MSRQIRKLCGADIELGNFILGSHRRDGSGYDAARALLAEVDGVPAQRALQYSLGAAPWPPSNGSCRGTGFASVAPMQDPQNWGRKFLANGGGVYIDLGHLEICVPEVVSAFDHVAATHAMLRVARRALARANAALPSGQRIEVQVNNSDGDGHAYGSHVNFLTTREAFEDIFSRRLHYLLFLASFQASAVVLAGQGKVGAENHTPPVAFQIGQRADFTETLLGVQTTYHRPAVNSRDEPLCGPGRKSGLARLHCIAFDGTLCHVASLLKIGCMQIVLAMIEAGVVSPALILDDPVAAGVRWSHDPTLKARECTLSGVSLTAVEMQMRFLEEARRFADKGRCDGIVPRAREILDLWEDVLLKLRARDFPALAGKLDWVLKRCALERAMEKQPGLDWDAPEIKYLDLIYSSLDRSEGLYWAYEDAGIVERVVSEDEIDRFVDEPPADTRAWGRAALLRLGGSDVTGVDWDSVTFQRSDRSGWSRSVTVELNDPFGFTRADLASVIEGAGDLDELLDALQPEAWKPRAGGNNGKPAALRMAGHRRNQ